MPSAAAPQTHISFRHHPEHVRDKSHHFNELLNYNKHQTIAFNLGNYLVLARILFSSDVIAESKAQVTIRAEHTGQSGRDKVWKSERTSQYSLIRAQAPIETAVRYINTDISACHSGHDWQVVRSYQGWFGFVCKNRSATTKEKLRGWQTTTTTSPNICRRLDAFFYSFDWHRWKSNR